MIDLQADGFNPVLSADELVAWRRHEVVDPLVRTYQDRLATADHLVFVFPIWWESMPASTNGFLDKTPIEGFAYTEPPRPGARFVNLLTGLQGVSLLTVTAIPTMAYRLWFKMPAQRIIFGGAFNKMGIKNFQWRNYDGVSQKSLEKRRELLADNRRHFSRLQDRRPARLATTEAEPTR